MNSVFNINDWKIYALINQDGSLRKCEHCNKLPSQIYRNIRIEDGIYLRNKENKDVIIYLSVACFLREVKRKSIFEIDGKIKNYTSIQNTINSYLPMKKNRF